MSSALMKRLEKAEPLALSMAGIVTETVYGVVDKINDDGTPHFVRRWKGAIGNMRETDEEPSVYVIEKLEPFILKHKKYKGAFGGRAGTKSIMAMDAMVGDVNAVGSKVYVLREHMKALKNSVYAGIKGRITSLQFPNFTPVPSQWEIKHRNGGLFSFGGMQNIRDVKSSFEYKYILLEESENTSQETLDILGPTLRGVEGAEMWLIWNPASSNDPMSQEFINPFQADIDRQGYYEDDYHLIIKVGFEDNPWFSYDSSLSTEYAKDKNKVEDGRMSKARFNHIWHGGFNDDIEDSIIDADWFDACIDAHIKLGFQPVGAKVATHDPADVGNDAKGYALRHGVVFTDLREIDAPDANRAFDIACGYANQAQIDIFGWDCDGMGALLRDQCAVAFKNKNVKTFMFKGSESPHMPEAIYAYAEDAGITGSKKNKDVFRNKRAQNYINLADRCRKTYEAVVLGMYHNPDELVSFSSGLDCIGKLRSELCQIPKKPNSSGRLELYTKQDMKSGILMSNGQRRKMPSPNLADCVMMSFDNSGTIKHQKIVMPTPLRTMGRR